MLMSFIYVSLCIYLCVHTWVLMCHDFWILEDNLQESALSFQCVGPGDPALVIKLGTKYLYSLSHPSGLTLSPITSGKLDVILHSATGKESAPPPNFIQKFSLSLLSLWLGNIMTRYSSLLLLLFSVFTFILFGCKIGEFFHHYCFKHFLSILPSLSSFHVPITYILHYF